MIEALRNRGPESSLYVSQEVGMKRSIYCILSGLFALVLPWAQADEVCDQFPDVNGTWTFRVPACGPTISLEDNEGFLHFSVPDGFTVGYNYDNWSGADRAPTLQSKLRWGRDRISPGSFHA